ncbi:hypothetical protein [Phenylobacterium deserti]|uniref:Uncharacterized protein n=1 Tax=Phenylobacterium deserti TaxID=1914756 RepID=A0A328A9E5_9CAUL|nr:hypothetical protein [Phenylobacterium deserti]RAK50977.1 hypothetical protein DJ018_17625 [Phenylobacterium deserti]
MANRDDYRGYRGERPETGRQDRGRDDWGWSGGRDQRGGQSSGQGGERRSFGDEGRFNSDQARYGEGSRGGRGEGEMEPWRRERYGSRFDQDRVNYGSGYDRERQEYGRGTQDERGRTGGNRASESYGGGYGGQEYGMEGQGFRDRNSGEGRTYGGGRTEQRDWGNQGRERWREGQGGPYGDLELNARNSGIQEFGAPHDYAYHPKGNEFDPDYNRWRDEQLASHDRDYQEWRRHQHEQYDNEYRQYRAQRRDNFGTSFQTWRTQRTMTQGVENNSVAPGMAHDSTTDVTGGGIGADAGKPTGALEGLGGLTPSSTLTQTGGGHKPTAQGSSTGDKTPEFGREPTQVQSASDGASGRARDLTNRDDDKNDKTKS